MSAKLSKFDLSGVGGGGGLRLGSKEEGPKGVCDSERGGGCFASVVCDNFLNFFQNLTYSLVKS